MDTQSIWDMLSKISIGTIMAWIFVSIAIISFLCTVTIKVYKLFEKYKNEKDKNEEQKKMIETHEKNIEEIGKSLSEIQKSLNEQKEVNLKQIRHTIVHTCEDVLEKKEISINKLRSLEEMYGEYTEVFHGNGYVKTLVLKVRQLPVVGKIDD